MSVPPSPCIVAENEDIGLQDAVDKRRKRSSILKIPKSPARPALQDLDVNQQEDDTKRRASRRVSFAEKYQIKEYLTDSVSLCFWNDTQEKPIPHSDESTSASSESDPSIGSHIHGLETLLSGEIHCNNEYPDVFEDRMSIPQTLVDDPNIRKKRKGSAVLTQGDSRTLHASTAVTIAVTAHKDKKRKVLTPIDGQPAAVDVGNRSYVFGDKTVLHAEDMDMTYKDCTVTRSIIQNINVDMNLLTLNRTCCTQEAMEFTYIDDKTVHTTSSERNVLPYGNKTILFTETGACDMSVTSCFDKSFVNVSEHDRFKTDEDISDSSEVLLGDSEETCPVRSSVSGIDEPSEKFDARELLKHFQCNVVNSLPGVSDLSALGDKLHKRSALIQLDPAQENDGTACLEQSTDSGNSVASEKIDTREFLKHFQCNIINTLPVSSELSALSEGLLKDKAVTIANSHLVQVDCEESCSGQSSISTMKMNGNVAEKKSVEVDKNKDAYILDANSAELASPVIPTVNFFPPVSLSTGFSYSKGNELQTNISETNCMASATYQPDVVDCVNVTKYYADDMEPTECVSMNAVFSNEDPSPYCKEGFADLTYPKLGMNDMEETQCANVGISFPLQFDDTSVHPKASRRQTMIFDDENAYVEMTGVVDATIVVALNNPLSDNKENNHCTGLSAAMGNADKENVSRYGSTKESDTFNTRKEVSGYQEPTLLGLEELRIDDNTNETPNGSLTCEPTSVLLQEAELALNIMSNHKSVERSVQSTNKFNEPAFQDVTIDMLPNRNDIQCDGAKSASSAKDAEAVGMCGKIVSLETVESCLTDTISEEPMETCDKFPSNPEDCSSLTALSSRQLPLSSVAESGIVSPNLLSKEIVSVAGNSPDCFGAMSRKRSLLQNIDYFSCQNVLNENSILESKRCKEQKLDVEISSVEMLNEHQQFTSSEKHSSQADVQESLTLSNTPCPSLEHRKYNSQTGRACEVCNPDSASCPHETLPSVFEKSVQQTSMYAFIDSDVRRCCQELVLAADTCPVRSAEQIQGHTDGAQFAITGTEENEVLKHSTSCIKNEFIEDSAANKASESLALNSTSDLAELSSNVSARCYSQSSVSTRYPTGASKEYSKDSVFPVDALSSVPICFDGSQTAAFCTQRNEEIKVGTKAEECKNEANKRHKAVSDVASDLTDELPDMSAKLVAQSNTRFSEDVEKGPMLTSSSCSVPLYEPFSAHSGAAPQTDIICQKLPSFPMVDIETDSNSHDPFVSELAPVSKNLEQPNKIPDLFMDVNGDSQQKIKASVDLPSTYSMDVLNCTKVQSPLKVMNVKASPLSQADTSMAPLWSLSQRRNHPKARKKISGNDADVTKSKSKCRIKLSSHNNNAATTASDKNATSRLSDATLIQGDFKPAFNSTMVKDLLLPRSPEENVSITTECNSPGHLALSMLQTSTADCQDEHGRLDMPSATTSSCLLKPSEASCHQGAVESICNRSNGVIVHSTVDMEPRLVIEANPPIKDKSVKSGTVADKDELMHDETLSHSSPGRAISTPEEKTIDDRQIVCMAPSLPMSQKVDDEPDACSLLETSKNRYRLKEMDSMSVPSVYQAMHESEPIECAHEVSIQHVDTGAAAIVEERRVQDKGCNQSLGSGSDKGSDKTSEKMGEEQTIHVDSDSVVCKRETKIQEVSDARVEKCGLEPDLFNPAINESLQTKSNCFNHSTAAYEVSTLEKQLPHNCQQQAVEVENCAASNADTCDDQKMLPEHSSMSITKLVERSAVMDMHTPLMRAEASSLSLGEDSLLDVSQLSAFDSSFDRRSIPIAAADNLSSVSCLPVVHSPLNAIKIEAELTDSTIKVVEPPCASQLEANEGILPETEEPPVVLDEEQTFEELCKLLKIADATLAIADLAECSLRCMTKKLPSASDVACLEGLDHQIVLDEKRLEEINAEKEQTLRSIENMKKRKSELEAEVKARKADIIREDKEIEKLEVRGKELEELFSLTRSLVGFNLERADSSGVSITYMWGSLCLDVVYGEALTETTVHPAGFPLHKIQSIKLNVRKAALSPLMVLAHNMVLKAVDQTLFDSVRTSWELYKVIDYVSLLTTHSRWLTEDVDQIAGRIMDIEEDKIVVQFSNMVVHTMFSVSFPLVPGDYPEEVILPMYNKILGKDLEAEVLEVLRSVKPGWRYLKKMVQAVDDLLKHTANYMHTKTIMR